MMASSLVSFAFYATALAACLLLPKASLVDVSGVALWMFVLAVMLGVIAGNVRSIALPTLVTLLIPEDRRDRANGLVGMATGIGFLTTSAISGFLVAWGGMGGALALALVLTLVAFLHLLFVRVDEPPPEAEAHERKRVDLAGTIRVVAGVPGLFALILFAAFNNFLGGIFMALLDAYGLSLMSVENWGLLWAFVSSGFIVSGFVIARTGLGANPLRTLLLVNLAAWCVSMVFTVQSSIPLLAAGSRGAGGARKRKLPFGPPTAFVVACHPRISAMKVIGAHSILYSKNAEADRTFLRDVLGFPHVDVGGGWLIFGLPPSEVAIHPGDEGAEQEFYLMVDDVEAFVAEMAKHGRPTAPLTTQPYGVMTSLTLPSGHEVGVYQPTHERPPPP